MTYIIKCGTICPKGVEEMAISDKLRAILALNGKKSADLAAYYGISPQAMRNKFSRGSFSADDLIKMAMFLGAELSFHAADQVITLDERDLQDHGHIGTPIPNMEDIAQADGGKLIDKTGKEWDAGLVKINDALGGGYELAMWKRSAPEKRKAQTNNRPGLGAKLIS